MHLREHTHQQENLIDIDPAELAELPFELATLDLGDDADDADEGDALTALYGELTKHKVPSLSARISELASAKTQRRRARRKG